MLTGTQTATLVFNHTLIRLYDLLQRDTKSRQLL